MPACLYPATRVLLLVLAVLGLAACTTTPPPIGPAIPIVWRESPNFEVRRPNLVILHHTSSSDVARALAALTSTERKVSAHYLIGRDGKIFQLVDERNRAWHAGVSYWGGQTDINSASIGVELDNTGFESYPDVQIQALLALLSDIKARYRIPTANFIGHGDVAPGRKGDPGALFPWKRLAENGFGLWCDIPDQVVPAGFDFPTGLMALGYNPANPASFGAFLSHFVGSPGAEKDDPMRILGLLYCLLRQKSSEGTASL